MKIEFTTGTLKSNAEFNQSTTILDLPFKVEFINKTSSLLKSFRVCINGQTENTESSLIFNDSFLALPFAFEKEKHNNKTFIFRLQVNRSLEPETDYTISIDFYFEFNNESILTNTHDVIVRIDKSHKIELQTKPRKSRHRSYINLGLLLLTILLYYWWNTTNNDVLNQPWWLTPAIVAPIGTFILLFFGLEIRQLTKHFKRLPTLQNFFRNAEFYIEPNLLKILRSKGATLIFSLSFAASVYFVYNYSPLNLPLIDAKTYSFYLDTSEVKNKKVYRTDVDKIKIALRKDLMSDEFKIIPVAECNEILFSFNTTYHFIRYKYYRNCNFTGNDSYADSLDIERIIKKPTTEIDSLINSRLKGKQNKVVYLENDTCFCFDKDGEFTSGSGRIESDIYSPGSVVQLL